MKRRIPLGLLMIYAIGLTLVLLNLKNYLHLTFP